MKRAAGAAAFTLVEVLAAMVFLGILLPVVTSAILLSNRAGVLAERSTTAVQLAENRLNELVLTNTWSSGSSRGTFDEQDFPGYRWEMERGDWPVGAGMTELTMKVFFMVQGREQQVQVATLANASTSTAAATTGTAPTSSSTGQ